MLETSPWSPWWGGRRPLTSWCSLSMPPPFQSLGICIRVGLQEGNIQAQDPVPSQSRVYHQGYSCLRPRSVRHLPPKAPGRGGSMGLPCHASLHISLLELAVRAGSLVSPVSATSSNWPCWSKRTSVQMFGWLLAEVGNLLCLP